MSRHAVNNSSIVWRLLRHNISAGQLAGFAAANLVGLVIVITAIQFYRDVTGVWGGEDSFVSKDYMIISPRVSTVGSFLGGDNSFSPDDISGLESQPWVRRVGEFTTASFNVYAEVNLGGRPLGTALFLESIPDGFIDNKPDGWGYQPGAPVPVIISRDYLTLYNFGFASSRGLPQVSEAMIGMVPLRLSLSGNGAQEWVEARIVGFSSRLNTIAVPGDFMKWANDRFAEPGAPQAPRRLIVELATPGDPAARDYIDSHGWEVAGDKLDNGRAAYFLTVVTAVVVTVGVIISALAFFILLLSIWLLLQKNKMKLHDLMLLGYSPAEVARYYRIIVLAVNGGVLVVAVAVMLAAAHRWAAPLESIGITVSSVWPTVAIAVAIVGVITAGNLVAISHNVKKVFRI